MKEGIKVSTGDVVAIGELKVFATEKFPYNIPDFSFLVSKSDDGLYTATCFDLLISVTAGDEMIAVGAMRQGCAEFLTRLFGDKRCDAWAQLHELLSSGVVQEFVDAYKHIRLNLAECGIDVNAGREKYLLDKISQIEKELSELKGKGQGIDVDVVNYEKAA